VSQRYRDGEASPAIARAEGISKRRVLGILSRHGVERRPWPRPVKYPEPGERVCARSGCDRRFRPKPSDAARGNGNYCSRAHADEAKRKYARPEPRVCPVTGVTFTPTSVQVANGRGHFATLEAYWESDYLADLTSDRLRALHADPVWNARWAYSRHRSTRLFGRANKQLAEAKGKTLGPRGGLDRVQREEILSRHAAGQSQRQIALYTGHDRKTIRRVILAG
jgi:hypothetical protein